MSNRMKKPHFVLHIRCTVFHRFCCLRGRMCLPCSIDLDIDARRSRLAICALHILCATRLPAFLQRQFKRTWALMVQWQRPISYIARTSTTPCLAWP